MIEAGWNYKPYLQVKISHWSNQEGEIFVQRSIFREFIQTKIIHHSEWQVNKCLDHLSCVKIPLRSNRNFKIIPTEKQVKIPMRILILTLHPQTNIVQDTESYPQMCWTCPLPKTIQSASERLKWPEAPSAFWAARHDCGRKAYIFPQLLPKLLPQTWTTEATRFLSILKYSSKSSFRNLRGRNEFIERWNPVEQRATRQWIAVAAPIPVTEPACC